MNALEQIKILGLPEEVADLVQWLTAEGFTLSNKEIYGSFYDLRLEFSRHDCRVRIERVRTDWCIRIAGPDLDDWCGDFCRIRTWRTCLEGSWVDAMPVAEEVSYLKDSLTTITQAISDDAGLRDCLLEDRQDGPRPLSETITLWPGDRVPRRSLYVPDEDMASFICCLGVGVLQMIRQGVLPPEVGIWTLGVPRFWEPLEADANLPAPLLNVIHQFDELSAIHTISPDRFDSVLAELITELESVLAATQLEGWGIYWGKEVPSGGESTESD
jgi:hypothetical protein